MTDVLPQLACSTITLRNISLGVALEKAAGFGFDTVDLGALAGLCEHIPPKGTSAELRSAGAIVRASGLGVSSVNADPGSFSGSHTSDGTVLNRIGRLLEFCAENASPRLVLTCGDSGQPNLGADKHILAVADGLNQAARIAENYPVELVVEAPHYFRLTNTMDRTRRLLERLNPAVGQAWDVSHVRAAGEDPAALFAEFAHRVSIIHLRDAVPGDIRRSIGQGDIDFESVFKAANTAGFAGPFVLELETHNSPYQTKDEEVRASMNYLNAARQPASTAEARR